MTEPINFANLSNEEIPLETLLENLTRIQTQRLNDNSELEAAKRQLASLNETMQTLRREALVLENSLKSQNVEFRNLEKQIELKKRQKSLEEEQARLQDEFIRQAKRLDELTASAKWREFAFDHQIEGGKRLAVAKRGILGDRRGLGKTLTGLVWSDMVEGKKVLVIAPNDVVPQFEDEIRTWAPSRTIFSMRGLPKSQRDLIYPMMGYLKEFIITLNYEAWRRDKSIIDDLVNLGIDTIILDEAHRIKSSEKLTARGVFEIAYRPNYCENCDKVGNLRGPWNVSKTARLAHTDREVNTSGFTHTKPAVLYTCPTCSQPIVSTVKNVLCMTGTPILNRPVELFSLLYLVDWYRWPLESSFLRDNCISYGGSNWQWRPGGLQRLTRTMSEFFLQRTREDAGITVPPPDVKVHKLDKDFEKYPAQYEAERRLTQEAMLMLENGERKDIFFILEMILRERQIMTWPAGIAITDPDTKQVICRFDVEESQKLDAATELVTDLILEEERIVIFSQFKGPLYEMERRLKEMGVSVVMATGDQSDQLKTMVRQDFDLKTASKTDYKWQVVLATYKAFGTGINLNAARQMILLDDEWSPGMQDQAVGRIDRMNSEDQANVHIFRVNKSIDDFMANLLEEKKKMLEEFDGFSMEAALRTYFG